jgi:hypothetical protein
MCWRTWKCPTSDVVTGTTARTGSVSRGSNKCLQNSAAKYHLEERYRDVFGKEFYEDWFKSVDF